MRVVPRRRRADVAFILDAIVLRIGWRWISQIVKLFYSWGSILKPFSVAVYTVNFSSFCHTLLQLELWYNMHKSWVGPGCTYQHAYTWPFVHLISWLQISLSWPRVFCIKEKRGILLFPINYKYYMHGWVKKDGSECRAIINFAD